MNNISFFRFGDSVLEWSSIVSPSVSLSPRRRLPLFGTSSSMSMVLPVLARVETCEQPEVAVLSQALLVIVGRGKISAA